MRSEPGVRYNDTAPNRGYACQEPPEEKNGKPIGIYIKMSMK
jgi:hypothetical protein